MKTYRVSAYCKQKQKNSLQFRIFHVNVNIPDPSENEILIIAKNQFLPDYDISYMKVLGEVTVKSLQESI